MTTFTMVARTGLEKAKAEDMIYSLIGEDYNIIAVKGSDLMKKIASKEVAITNLGIENGKLVSTNGAIDKYPFVNMETGQLSGKQCAVVLNRVEVNERLMGYTIMCPDGIIREMKVPEAVTLYNSVGIANGKIRQSSAGPIISSINGNFPLRVLTIKNAESKDINLGVTFITTGINETHSATYAGVIINCKNAADMAKMFNKLKEENDKVKAIVKKLGESEESISKLQVTRIMATEIYCVMTLDMLNTMLDKNQFKLNFPMDSLLISSLDFSDGKTESLIKLGKDFKMDKLKDGNGRTLAEVKKLAEKVIPKFRNKGLTN